MPKNTGTKSQRKKSGLNKVQAAVDNDYLNKHLTALILTLFVLMIVGGAALSLRQNYHFAKLNQRLQNLEKQNMMILIRDLKFDKQFKTFNREFGASADCFRLENNPASADLPLTND